MRKYFDKKLFLILMCYVALYHVVYIFRRVVLKWIGVPEYGDVSWWKVVADPLFTNALIVPPVVVIVMVLTRIMILRKYPWAVMIIVHFFFSFVYGFLLFLSLNIYNYFQSGDFIPLFTKEAWVIMLFSSNLQFLGYVGFVVIIYAYHYLKRNMQAEVQQAQLSEQLITVRMEALKSQLNPHFLFNTLNSISALIEEDSVNARLMLVNLSDLLREVLLVKRENLISVNQEIHLTNKYIEIMKMRFSDHLVVHVLVDEALKEELIPSMVLQPLVENSIKHGYSYDITSLTVTVSIKTAQEWIVIEVINNGASLKNMEGSKGLGLHNIEDRLKSLYGTKYEFRIQNRGTTKGVSTRLKVPAVLNKIKEKPTRMTI